MEIPQEFSRNSTRELPLSTRADQLLTMLSRFNSTPWSYYAPSSKSSVNLFYLKIPFAVESHDQSQQHFQCRYNNGFYCSGLSAASVGTRISDWSELGCSWTHQGLAPDQECLPCDSCSSSTCQGDDLAPSQSFLRLLLDLWCF